MKKVLSLVLAAMMVLAMGVTAFAAADDYAMNPLYPYNVGESDFIANKPTVQPNGSNSKAWIALSTDGSALTAAKEGDVEDVKLTAKVVEGKDFVSSIALATADNYSDAGADDEYGILIKFKDYFDISKATVKVELTIKSKRGSTLMDKVTVTFKLDNKTPVLEISESGLALDAANDNSYNETHITSWKPSNSGKDITIKDLVKFQKEIQEVNRRNTIAGVDFKAGIEYMELNADLFSYSVKMSEQGKLSLDFDQKVNKPIARAVDPDVELTFFNFNARPSFDFTGTAEIYLPDEDIEYYLYEITEDGNLASVRGAKLNEDGDAITFKTRTLGCYVLSDAPLELDVDEEPNTDVDVPSTDKDNPTTGAAVVAVAAAL